MRPAVFAALFLCLSAAAPAHAQRPEGQMSLPDQMKELYYGPQSAPADNPQTPLREDGPMGSNFGMECNTCRGGVTTPAFATVPEKLRGIWGAPDCGDTVDLLYQTKHFSTWAGPEARACMEIFIASTAYGPNLHVETSSGQVFLQFTNDGLMRTGPVDPEVGIDKEKAADPDADITDIIAVEGREYAQCGFLPSTAHPVMRDVIKTMARLDAMVDVCYVPGNPLPLVDNTPCADWLFAAADADSSGALKRDEIEDATYLALSAYDMIVECTNLSKVQDRNQDDVLTAADMLLSSLDSNGDYALDKAEVASLYAKGEMPEKARDKMVVLQEIFPFLRPKTFDFAPAAPTE